MLPNDIPISSLPRLLKDFASLIKLEWDPGTDPRHWIAGCGEDGRDTVIPWEYDPGDLELNPRKRLAEGEELALRLHTPYVQGALTLIDGREYIPAGLQADDDAALDEDNKGATDDAEPADFDDDTEWLDFPTEPSFFALGIYQEGDNLRLRPVVVYGCSNLTPSPNLDPGLVRESLFPWWGWKGFSDEEATQYRADRGPASAG